MNRTPSRLLAVCVVACSSAVARAAPFVVRVIDEATGRGVPLVELKTTAAVTFYSDSAGVVAVDEPSFVGQRVFFSVSSPGYEAPADAFGYRGTAFDITAGGSATIKLHRTIIAERLYRLTGEGIYRDSVVAKLKTPIKRPLLNAGVVGQDTVQAAVYRGKIYWFWGDTARTSYPLGNFHTTGATSDLPSKGGLAPDVGVDFGYFTTADGAVKEMIPSDKPGPMWISGLFTITDEKGRERLVAEGARVDGAMKAVERNIIVFDDDKSVFETLKALPLDDHNAPNGHPFRARDGAVDYVYFPRPFPTQRVRADWKSVLDPAAYEVYTPLPIGAKWEDGKAFDGKPAVWSWKRGGTAVDQRQAAKLGADAPINLRDAAGKAVVIAGGSVQWNAHRKRFVMIGTQSMGDSVLGEVWYAEAERPEGPWRTAVKVASHGGMDFYNPTQDEFFQQQGGKYIYFEGTYTNTFSGIKHQTPRYDYNQLMYRLDVDDARLKPARGE